jgi:hypothetical protein
VIDGWKHLPVLAVPFDEMSSSKPLSRPGHVVIAWREPYVMLVATSM